ncbi:MAG: PilZ domain-containing protein [Candidatus Krumholzibacteriales bacterium]
MRIKERRRAERIDVSIPLDVSGEGDRASGETINISMNGIYFRSNQHIDPLTKVQMGLVIPVGEGGEEKEEKAMFDGVVVRTEPEKRDDEPDAFRIAVYITYMSKDSRAVLSDFIRRYI